MNDVTALQEDVFYGLSRLEDLTLSGNELAELPAGVFSGLADLTGLSLERNQLTGLPAGVFADLPQLRWLRLVDNPGSPFPLTLEPRRTDSNDLLAPSPARVAVMVAEGAPFAMEVPLSIIGGGLSPGTVTIATGDATSSEVTVTQTQGRQAPTRINVGRLPKVPEGITGITLQAGDPLLLFATASANALDNVSGGLGAQRRKP